MAEVETRLRRFPPLYRSYEATHAVTLRGVTAALPIHCGTIPLLTGMPDQHPEVVGETDVEAIELNPSESLR